MSSFQYQYNLSPRLGSSNPGYNKYQKQSSTNNYLLTSPNNYKSTTNANSFQYKSPNRLMTSPDKCKSYTNQ